MRRYVLGTDVGSVSLNVAVLDEKGQVVEDSYTRLKGRPVETFLRVVGAVLARYGADTFRTAAITGSGGKLIADLLKIEFVNEVIAQARAVEHLHPDARTIIEIGGEDSKLIQLKKDPRSGRLVIEDFAMNTICAAGTGSFLDQQATRLGVSIEKEFGELALKSKNPPRVAGRCSVFAKSDMIHLQQQATPDYDIVAGLCHAMARNLKSNLGKGKEFTRPVCFQGGVAANKGVVKAFETVLELKEGELIIPKYYASMGAIGAALIATDRGVKNSIESLKPLEDYLAEQRSAVVGHRARPLAFSGDTSKRHYIRGGPKDVGLKREDGRIPAYLGVDVGSISTNVVLIDQHRNLLAKSYLMTAGRPLEAVRAGLKEVYAKVGDKVKVMGVGTTGSGRYLTGDFVGADVVRNEITAQATGAISIDPTVDTIFEIGGQDSKFISLDNGVVVDFEMNHVCAAGTGSFLEEQAEKLGINIINEFGNRALACKSPIRLGERCTVFMESNLVHCQQNGARLDELVSGLAYSIVHNYLNRVVAHRRVGNRIFFQGGVAANRGVVAAFEKVTGKDIFVPEHHEVTGAIGAAILALEHQKATGATATNFRGFDLSERRYTIRPFECRDCANNCEIKEVTIEGEEPLYYGSRCDKYNLKRKRKLRKVVDGSIPNLFAEREEMLLNAYKPKTPGKASRGTIGMPRALFMHSLYPYWNAFFTTLGFEVVLSERSNKRLIHQGVETVASETCFPVKVMHGHVLSLLEKGVDYLFLPSIVNLKRDNPDQDENYLCPYVQTIPYTVKAAFDFSAYRTKVLCPVVHFDRPQRRITKALAETMKPLGISRSEVARAVKVAHATQDQFEAALERRGQQALKALTPEHPGMVILSRPYNGCDPGINLGLSDKLRDLGVVAIPMDFLSINRPGPDTEWDNMFWRYGQKIMRAAEFVRKNPNLNAIYLTNFGCGPDSFINTFVKAKMGDKPLLILEIDEHSADAGVITRCEAYLDSLRNRPKQAEIPPAFRFHYYKSNGEGRVLYIPHMCEHAHAFASAFRACGMEAETLPMSDEQSLEYGKPYTLGKECLPCIVTTGDMLKKLREPGFNPKKAAFFMASGSGPCRFGHYANLHRLVLRQVGYGDVPVISPNQGQRFYDDFKELKKDPTRIAWQGMVCVDVLLKALLTVRPYERTPGTTDRVFNECLEDICKTTEAMGDLEAVMKQSAKKFEAIPVDRSKQKPVIGIVGEIYVRSHEFCNQFLIRQLESLGAETKLAAMSEWIYYTNFCRARRALVDWDLRTWFQTHLKDRIQRRYERKFSAPFLKLVPDVMESITQHILDLSNPYIHDTYEGEAPLSVGKTVEFYHTGAHGVVNTMPFTCMPGTVVTAVLKRMRRDCEDFPCLSIAYDGQEQANTMTRLEAFVHQAKQFMEGKKEVRIQRSEFSKRRD
jgi:predicted CoA-substrate-specific enzyme activase